MNFIPFSLVLFISLFTLSTKTLWRFHFSWTNSNHLSKWFNTKNKRPCFVRTKTDFFSDGRDFHSSNGILILFFHIFSHSIPTFPTNFPPCQHENLMFFTSPPREVFHSNFIFSQLSLQQLLVCIFGKSPLKCFFSCRLDVNWAFVFYRVKVVMGTLVTLFFVWRTLCFRLLRENSSCENWMVSHLVVFSTDRNSSVVLDL